jgi:predicted ester cyclase
VEEVIAEGDIVAMRLTLRGTHDGDFMGFEPTGNTFAVSNMVFSRIEDGRIAKRWVVPDMAGMLDQLGIVETPMRA